MAVEIRPPGLVSSSRARRIWMRNQFRAQRIGLQLSGSMGRLLLVVVGRRGAEHIRPQQMAGHARRCLDGEDVLGRNLAALTPVADHVLGNANGGSELSDAASYFDCLG
ncbi:hypothetical protein A9K61_04315 [Stenotrophomonas maltophilia]|nr:hypothetical protein A9K61_04315 [Stenotrophomonas maltophilia]